MKGTAGLTPGASGNAPGASVLAPGIFIAVVGPSGAGKDTLIAAARERLAGDDRFAFPSRWITRPPDPTEPSEELTRAEWERRCEAGECALSWKAHGIAYAIPAHVDGEIAGGRAMIANTSRGVLGDALARFPRSAAIIITASRDTLARRLAERGREDAADRTRRLARAPRPVPPGMRTIEVANDGDIEEATDRFVDAVRQLAAAA